MGRNFNRQSTDRVSLGDITEARFERLEAWTVLAFIRVENTVADDNAIVSKGISDLQFYYRVDRGPAAQNIEVFHNGGLLINTGSVIQLDTWYLCTVSCDGTGNPADLHASVVEMDGTFVVDQQAGTTSSDASTLTEPIEIGRLGNNTDFTDGDVANVAYIKQELTKDQITAYLYSPLRTALTFGTNLAFFIPLGHGATTEPDLGGKGNNGTVTATDSVIGDNPPVGPLLAYDSYDPSVFAVAAPIGNTRLLLTGVGV